MSRSRPLGLALAVVLAAGCGTLARAGEAHVYLAPYAFDSSLTGTALVSGGRTGTDFDLEDTLGLDPDDTVHGLDGFFKFAGSRIAFGYSSGSYDGGARLDEDVVFDGTTFPAGVKVRPEIDMKRYKLMYGFDFSFTVVNVGFLVGGQYVDIESRLKSSGLSESESLKTPIPAVGATLGIHPVSHLAIHAELTGFHAKIAGVDATMIDGFAGVDYLFVPHFGISGGYRYFALDATDDHQENSVDIKQRGPFVALVLHL